MPDVAAAYRAHRGGANTARRPQRTPTPGFERSEIEHCPFAARGGGGGGGGPARRAARRRRGGGAAPPAHDRTPRRVDIPGSATVPVLHSSEYRHPEQVLG
ncbi:hypothetical protein, partial [Nocardia asiatica]|uniref:hypothetical protein n=1 Tax=Nocardia asiatica TaxID=209252 RepID=UPI0024588675